MMLKYDLYGNSNSEPNYFFFFGPIANILLTKFLYAKSSIQLKFTFHFISFSVWISEGQPIASYTIHLQISFCAVIFPFCFHKMMIMYFYFAIVIHRLSYTNVWINVQCACLCVYFGIRCGFCMYVCCVRLYTLCYSTFFVSFCFSIKFKIFVVYCSVPQRRLQKCKRPFGKQKPQQKNVNVMDWLDLQTTAPPKNLLHKRLPTNYVWNAKSRLTFIRRRRQRKRREK